MTCPRCRRKFPGWAAVSHGWAESPVQSSKYCPYCGALLEQRTWPYVLLLIAALGLAVAARRILQPLIGWELLVFMVVVVVAHHVLWIIRRGRRRKNDSTPTRNGID